jgi:tyrosine-protein kinase Etk/Wzc
VPIHEDFELIEADDSVDLAQLWATLRKRWRFVVATGAAIFLCTLLYTMRSGMTFKSSGRLYLGDLELLARPGGQSGDMDISGTPQGDVGSEIEILKSQTLVSRAIVDSGFNVTIVPAGWKPPRYWKWLLSSRDPNIIDVPVRELIAADTTLKDDSRGAKLLSIDFAEDGVRYAARIGGSLIGTGRLGEPLQTSLATLTLRAGLERGPTPNAHYDLIIRPLDQVTDEVTATLVVVPAKGVGAEAAKVVNLEFTDGSPHFSANLLLALMNGYLGERHAWKTEDASAAETFVTDQLGSLRELLEKSEQKLADYRSNTRSVVLDNEANAMIEQVGKYEEQRVTARLQISALTDVQRALKLPNPPTEAFLLGEATDSVLTKLASTLTQARQTLTEMEAQYGPDAATTRQARGQVDVQLEMIRNYVTNRLSRAQESLNSLNKIIGQFEDKLKSVPGAELKLAQLGRESDVYSRVYSYMLERQQQAAIIKASTVSKNRILDFPHVPYREDAPKLGLRLASAPVGLLIGVILVLLHRIFANSFQSDLELRKALGLVPVYAAVPKRPERSISVFGDDGVRGTLDVVVGVPNSPYVEAFRTLRTNIYQAVEDVQSCVVTLVTSPSPGDGKTTCVLSLAEILAADKKRVLVIDADLRKPSHHDLNSQPLGPGLRGILSGQCGWRDGVSTVRVAYGTYDAIGAGKRAPAELLSRERVERFLNEVRGYYDFVLIDSPSFPLVSDALILATVANCVLTVVRVRNSTRRLTEEHVRRLASVAVTYGGVIVDSSELGTMYPLQTRQHSSTAWRERVLAQLETPRALQLLKLWVAVCIAIIVGAILVSTRDEPLPADVVQVGDHPARSAPATADVPPKNAELAPATLPPSAPPPAAARVEPEPPAVPAAPASNRVPQPLAVPPPPKPASVAPVQPLRAPAARPFLVDGAPPAAAGSPSPQEKLPGNPY